MQRQLIDILLVEDNPDDAGLTIRALQKNNLARNLLHVQDGEEALTYLYGLQGINPRLVLLDIKMPRVDGIEVLRKMKGDTRLKRIPVVMLTSSREDTDVSTAYDLGANSFIVKPVEYNSFGQTVKELGTYWMILNEQPQ